MFGVKFTQVSKSNIFVTLIFIVNKQFKQFGRDRLVLVMTAVIRLGVFPVIIQAYS